MIIDSKLRISSWHDPWRGSRWLVFVSLLVLISNSNRFVAFIHICIDLSKENEAEIEACASMLYGMIHARYVITGAGMQRMLSKYQNARFGCCPRVYCRNQPVLPIGLSDAPNQSGVNVFCPCCHDIYVPKSSTQGSVDGAFFGTTFAHLFLLLHPQYIPKRWAIFEF